jgi:hypothetical protein
MKKNNEIEITEAFKPASLSISENLTISIMINKLNHRYELVCKISSETAEKRP